MSRIGPGTHNLIIPGFLERSKTTRAHINGNAACCVFFLSLTSVLLQLGSQSANCGIVHSPSPTLITMSPTRRENDTSDCASAIISTHWHTCTLLALQRRRNLCTITPVYRPAASCRLKLMLALIAP